MHVPLLQTWPAAHWVSVVQLPHEWSGRHMPLGQSAPVLQPRSHTKSGRQYWPSGQLSFAPGRHATHRFVAGSHRGVAPPHCASSLHCTHWPLGTLQICPFRHAGFCCEQPAVHWCIALHTLPGPQSVSTLHATHWWFGASHTGLLGSLQSVLTMQPTHERVAGSHTGCGAWQSAFVTQPTQVPPSTSQTWPATHTGFSAEQPPRQT